MKTPNFSPNVSLSFRIRMAVLRTLARGFARLLAWAIAPALNAALRPIPTTANTPQAPGKARNGATIDGEFRRVDARHNDRW